MTISCATFITSLSVDFCAVQESIRRGEQQLLPQSLRAKLTIKQRKLSMEPTGVLHCLSCVTALKGEHATHCGEPDCSGVIDQLPGVIPRYSAVETNAGKNTLNLLSPAGSWRQGESSSSSLKPKQWILAGNVAVIYFFQLVQMHASNSVGCFGCSSSEKDTEASFKADPI